MGNNQNKNFFERFANLATSFTGSSSAFLIAASVVVVWAVTGPLFHFSETWQLVINTGTTIVTFLMVFLIQKAQNKDGKAIQLKLNELIAANRYASNRMVDIEDLTEDELDQLHKFYVKLSDLAEKEDDIHNSHSIDVAVTANKLKLKARRSSKIEDEEPEVKVLKKEVLELSEDIKKKGHAKSAGQQNKTADGTKSKKG